MIEKGRVMQERTLKARPGMPILILSILLYAAAIGSVILGGVLLGRGESILGGVLLGIGILWVVIGFIPFLGLKIIKPQEALVLTLFGQYIGTLREPGFYFVHPFAVAVNPAARTRLGQSGDVESEGISTSGNVSVDGGLSKKVSLKILTLNNAKQKVNDVLGNPVEIGVAVMWRVVDTAKAVFNVDNYKEYLSQQCDSAVRDIVRIYPYDVAPALTPQVMADPMKELTGSSTVVAERISELLQQRVKNAGLEILDARITYLAYAPEIAAVMLQRQQASAIIDARKMIVDGAVSIVQMALDKLSEEEVVQLDDERKAAMVSNLLVVLCGNRDAQPVVNSGSLY